MKAKFQKFGGAMFTPVLFFSVFGIVIAFCTVFRNPMIMGSLATEGTFWYSFWTIIQNGAWAVFNHLELLFVASLPLGLANKAQGKAAITSLVAYLGFITLISNILTFFGPTFGIDFQAESVTGVKMVAGVRTLDTGILGAILIALVVVYLHNKFYDKKLPQVLGTFQGSSYVVLVSFFVMIPLALITCLVWPKIQMGIFSLQDFIKSTGFIGVGVFTFLERFLLPTGLHHFVWQPFFFGPAVVEGGISPYYLTHMQEFADSSRPLIELFPEGVYGLLGNVKLFPPLGIGAAFYFTAEKSRRKKVLAVILPLVLTAIISGITEPLEFVFLFIAPQLFLAYSIVTGLMGATMAFFGVVLMGSGLIDTGMKFWVPMFANHSGMIFTQLVIGFIFTAIYFVVFRFMILKFNLATPGREVEEIVADNGTGSTKIGNSLNDYRNKAEGYLIGFGGKENIDSINNCATRLRIVVKDESKVLGDEIFKEYGAHGVVRNGKSFQVIVGLDVQSVRAEFDELVE